MDSNSLTPDQLLALARQLERHQRYMSRLRDRFIALGFREGDHIFLQTKTVAADLENLVYQVWQQQRQAASLYRPMRRAAPRDGPP